MGPPKRPGELLAAAGKSKIVVMESWIRWILKLQRNFSSLQGSKFDAMKFCIVFPSMAAFTRATMSFFSTDSLPKAPLIRFSAPTVSITERKSSVLYAIGLISNMLKDRISGKLLESLLEDEDEEGDEEIVDTFRANSAAFIKY